MLNTVGAQSLEICDMNAIGVVRIMLRKTTVTGDDKDQRAISKNKYTIASFMKLTYCMASGLMFNHIYNPQYPESRILLHKWIDTRNK